MAITPYTTPTQYQYKPLNLMAFAEPLMKMQEKYDLAVSALEDADVKATALQYATDPERAKALEQMYRGKRDELIANLLESKNYTQAASKLKQLNKYWLEDPERVALETNYKTFVERDKEEAARFAKGDITKAQYDQWKRDEIRKFEELGGTKYQQNAENPTGTYNPITGKVGRIADMQKEFDETKYKAAADIKAKKWDSGLSALGIDPTSQDAKYIKQSFEKLSPQEIDAAVEGYVRGLERFKPWLRENAAYDFRDILYSKDGGESFNREAERLLTKNYNNNEAYIKQLEKDKKTNSEEYKQALENRAFLETQLENPNVNVIQNMYTQDYMNKQYDAAALGQIFKVNNVKSDFTFRDLPNSGSGSGSEFNLDGLGRAAATTKELVSADLYAVKGNTTNNLLPTIKVNNNMANGSMRTLVMGASNSDFRKQITNNPAQAVGRQQQILAIFQSSKNASDFQSKLWNAGFTSGNTKETAQAVFTALSNPSTAQTFANNLQKMEKDYNAYVDADNQLTAVNNAAFAENSSLPQFKQAVKELEGSTTKYKVDYGTIDKLAKQWGTTPEKLIQSGVVEFTPARSGKEVYKEAEYRISPTNIAKAFGFKSVTDAVKNNFNFGKAGLDGNGIQYNINASRDLAFKANYQGNEMGFRLVGDPKVDKSLKEELLTVSDLTSFVPTQAKSWANIPGFDEEGRLMPGTKLIGEKTPKLVTRGNQVLLEIPYTYKDEDGKEMSRSIEVTAKPEQRAYFSQILRKVAIDNYQIKDKNAAAAQNYETFTVALFNNESGSKVTTQSANAAEVSNSRKSLTLETIPVGQGASVQIRKEYQGKDANPIYTAYIVSATGSQSLGIKAYDVNAVKVKLGEQMYLK